jgi:putative endonuclease
MNKAGYVYIVASKRNGTIYIGATSDLVKRAWQHRNGVVGGFTKRYGCKRLVWFQHFDSIDDARRRELQMKEWQRPWKLRVIEEVNPEWKDLYPTLL